MLEAAKCTIRGRKLLFFGLSISFEQCPLLAFIYCVLGFILVALEHSMTTSNARGHLAAGKGQQSTDKNRA